MMANTSEEDRVPWWRRHGGWLSGQLLIAPAVRKQRAMNPSAQLAFSFLRSQGPKPREWRRPHLEWVFLI